MAAPRVERGRLAFDGQFWGLPNQWSASPLTAPFVGAALCGLLVLLPCVCSARVRGDVVVESRQFIAYAAATALAAGVSWRLWRTGRRGPGCCLFAAGEEQGKFNLGLALASLYGSAAARRRR